VLPLVSHAGVVWAAVLPTNPTSIKVSARNMFI
jgi:hypothetical protein